jgi:hypothetical protein
MANHLEENKITVSLHESVFDGAGPERSANTTVEAVKLAEDVASVHYSPWTPSMFRLYGCLASLTFVVASMATTALTWVV